VFIDADDCPFAEAATLTAKENELFCYIVSRESLGRQNVWYGKAIQPPEGKTAEDVIREKSHNGDVLVTNNAECVSDYVRKGVSVLDCTTGVSYFRGTTRNKVSRAEPVMSGGADGARLSFAALSPIDKRYIFRKTLTWLIAYTKKRVTEHETRNLEAVETARREKARILAAYRADNALPDAEKQSAAFVRRCPYCGNQRIKKEALKNQSYLARQRTRYYCPACDCKILTRDMFSLKEMFERTGVYFCGTAAADTRLRDYTQDRADKNPA